MDLMIFMNYQTNPSRMKNGFIFTPPLMIILSMIKNGLITKRKNCPKIHLLKNILRTSENNRGWCLRNSKGIFTYLKKRILTTFHFWEEWILDLQIRLVLFLSEKINEELTGLMMNTTKKAKLTLKYLKS